MFKNNKINFLRRSPFAFVNRVKRPENLFKIDNLTDEIPLNHSIELESSFTTKKQNTSLIRSLKNKNKNSPKNKKASLIKKKNSLYLTDLGSTENESLNERLKNILSNQKNNKNNRSRSKNRVRSSPSSDSRSADRIKNRSKSRKSSQENKSRRMKLIPFNSGTLRDCGEKFILNDNPGVGMYNHADSLYYGILFIYF